MNRVIKVEVTQEHIDRGASNDCWSCPIALSLGNYFDKSKVFYEVDAHYIDFPNEDILCLLKEEAVSFIDDFDSNKKVKPFSFDLEVPKQLESFLTKQPRPDPKGN